MPRAADRPDVFKKEKSEVQVTDESERIMAELAELRAQEERAAESMERLSARLDQLCQRLRDLDV